MEPALVWKRLQRLAAGNELHVTQVLPSPQVVMCSHRLPPHGLQPPHNVPCCEAHSKSPSEIGGRLIAPLKPFLLRRPRCSEVSLCFIEAFTAVMLLKQKVQRSCLMSSDSPVYNVQESVCCFSSTSASFYDLLTSLGSN